MKSFVIASAWKITAEENGLAGVVVFYIDQELRH